ncbi:muconolactone Delta-isomerase family protein [Streptomyces sp. LZ34]
MIIGQCIGRQNFKVPGAPNGYSLNEILWGLPLFPYMDITVTPLAQHPSALH